MYTVMALSKSLTISTDFCQKKLFPHVACDYSVRTRVRLHDELLAGAPQDPSMACSRTARFFFPRPLGGAHFPHPMPARCSGCQVFLSTPLVSM
jgi:hypothetical protein